MVVVLAEESVKDSLTSSGPAVFDYEQWAIVHTNTFNSQQKKTPAPVSESWKSSKSEIFVAVAHYRDSRCGQTIYNYVKKASYPERLHFGKYSVLF